MSPLAEFPIPSPSKPVGRNKCPCFKWKPTSTGSWKPTSTQFRGDLVHSAYNRN